MLSSEAKDQVKDVFGTILLHKLQNLNSDTAWPAVLRSIMMDGKAGPLWNQLPALITTLMQSNIEVGAGMVFLMLYSSASQKSFNHGGMWGLCHKGTKEGTWSR